MSYFVVGGICFLVGGCFGVVLAALVAWSDRDDED